ncbi:DUF4429 domain-containing protein [Streptomyces sp. ME01-24h]|nr:DUF4429 domain-containing protein [Streptomyces sp. ME19-03-3]MDX3353785.1 DUF4429 domain-containing protein [Streptomyces sp. ME01-24h]
MGDVLAGSNAVWEFDADAVLIRYERGMRNSKLLQVLGRRRIPYQALAGVELGPGRRGTIVLRALARRGADPLMEAARGQLREAADPYRLVLPAERELLAEYYAQELRSAIDAAGGGADAGPASRHLVEAPSAPQAFKAYDGKASFDGETVSFRWFWTGASTAKWKAGDQHFAVAELSGVDWRSPEMLGGHLRLLPREADGRRAGDPDDDPATVVLGLGYGLVHESLPLAAAVVAAVQRATRTRPAPDPDGYSRAADVEDMSG